MRFERDFARAHDCEYGITTTNGTVSMEIALRAAGVKPGDEVIVPAYTFVATATAPLMVGAVPIFVDIEPETYNIDMDRVAEAITPRTRAIIPVHWAGQPCDMDRLKALAEKHGIVVLEDAAHAHGSSYKGRHVGAIGHLGSFSFQASKTMTAGEGGIITTNDAGLAARCESLVWAGRHPGQPWYCHYELASNARMTEFQAAVLSVQLARLDDQVRLRMSNAKVLDSLLGQIDGVRPLVQRPTTTKNSYYLYMFRYDPRAFSGLTKSRFIDALHAEGITTASTGYIWPLYRNPMFTERHFWGGPFPLESELYDRNIDYGAFASACPVAETACASEAVWITHETLLADEQDMYDIAAAVGKIQRHADGLA
jgi:dTDP-4-amino-4,6-dideoxygalactose transaminase